MLSRWKSIIMSLAAGALLAAGPALANEKAEPDPDKSTYWEPIRKIMFGDREILDGKDVLRVSLALGQGGRGLLRTQCKKRRVGTLAGQDEVQVRG